MEATVSSLSRGCNLAAKEPDAERLLEAHSERTRGSLTRALLALPGARLPLCLSSVLDRRVGLLPGAHGLVGTEWKPPGWMFGLGLGAAALRCFKHSFLRLRACAEAFWRDTL